MARLEYQSEELYYPEEGYSQFAWMRYLLPVLGIIGAVIIIVFAARNRLLVAFFAYFNCLVYTAFAVHFAKKGTLGALIPLISPLWLIVGTCLGIIYFSIFIPDGTYKTITMEVSYFAGGIKYQLVILMFLMTYLGTMAWMLRSERRGEQNPFMVSKYIAYLAAGIVMSVFCFHIFSTIIKLPPAIDLWASRLRNYYQGLVFLIGAAITKLSKTVKLWLLVFFGATGLFYALGNSRTWVLLPLISIATAIFFFSEVKTRTKAILLITVIFWVPWLLLVTNTVRTLLGVGGGTFVDLIASWTAIKDWRYLTERQTVGAGFFGRTFFTAGNVIVAYCPSVYPYKHFSLIEYAKEVGLSVMPGPIMRKVVAARMLIPGRGLQANYTGSWLLRDFDIYVTEGTSVEVSTIGNLWMLGGYIPVILGGGMLALIHAFVAWMIRRLWAQNPDKGIFYFSVFFFPILWTQNMDIIAIFRAIFLYLLFAYVGFKLVSPLLKTFYASMQERYQQLAL